MLVSNVEGTFASQLSRQKGTFHIVIPASAAFGTGEHATTAMSLRFLEHLTRGWEDGWSLADLGTGSGILALAAKRFGAGHVIGIDIDPRAIAIAEANARLNKIENVDFRLADLAQMETNPLERHYRRQSVQRVIDRGPTETETVHLAYSFRCAAHTGNRIPACSTTEQHRDRERETPREVDRSIGQLRGSLIRFTPATEKTKICTGEGRQLGSSSLCGFGFSASHAV